MSVRKNRKDQLSVLQEAIQQVVDQRGFMDVQQRALEIAREALSEEPRTITPCDLRLEYAPRQGTFEYAECGECETTFPFLEVFKWCPLCGSQIANVTREANAFDKLNRQVAARAVASLM